MLFSNGYSKKRITMKLGEADIRVPSDRNGENDPKSIRKYDCNTDGMGKSH